MKTQPPTYAEPLTGDPPSPAPPRKAPPSTGDRRIAKLFGLEGENWMRHANPASVWTRFTVLSILSLAIWSRDWIGAWSLLGVGLAIAWMFVNPLLFKARARLATGLRERCSANGSGSIATRSPCRS